MSNTSDWSKVAETQEQQILSKRIQGMGLRGSEGGSAPRPPQPSAAPAGPPPAQNASFNAPPGLNPVTQGRGRGLIRMSQEVYQPPGVRAAPSGATEAPGGATGATGGPEPTPMRDESVPQPPSASGDWDSRSEGSAATDAGSDDVGLTRADASLMNKMLRSRLINSTSDIEVLRKDPNSPLYHVKNFNNLRLKPELLRGVFDMGFNAPSKIQETALPALLADPPANMIAQSQSGTGKTAAFVLTMLSRVDPSKPHPQCLCLAPTYELALQIGDVTRRMAKFMPDVTIRYAIRGEWVERGSKVTEHIVIGTPGTVMDWCLKIRCVDPKLIRVFVLDEADVMIDKQGHADQSVRIQRELHKDCQLLLFSATYDEDIMKFATTLVSNPMVIRLKREEESLENIHQYFIECPGGRDDKLSALVNIYGSITIGQSVIFCHTRHTASWLVAEMTRQGNAVALLTGELDVKQRADIIGRFKQGKEKVLITTNVSARGIDVDQVTVVVNFDLPVDQRGQVDCETYLHRIGRTGRFGKNGLAINMVDGARTRGMLQTLEQHFGRKIVKLDAENPDEIEKIGNHQI